GSRPAMGFRPGTGWALSSRAPPVGGRPSYHGHVGVGCAGDHRLEVGAAVDWTPMTKTPGTIRIAAVADLHFGHAGSGPPLQPLLEQVAEQADVLALCGDLTDRGDPDEARALA